MPDYIIITETGGAGSQPLFVIKSKSPGSEGWENGRPGNDSGEEAPQEVHRAIVIRSPYGTCLVYSAADLDCLVAERRSRHARLSAAEGLSVQVESLAPRHVQLAAEQQEADLGREDAAGASCAESICSEMHLRLQLQQKRKEEALVNAEQLFDVPEPLRAGEGEAPAYLDPSDVDASSFNLIRLEERLSKTFREEMLVVADAENRLAILLAERTILFVELSGEGDFDVSVRRPLSEEVAKHEPLSSLAELENWIRGWIEEDRMDYAR